MSPAPHSLILVLIIVCLPGGTPLREPQKCSLYNAKTMKKLMKATPLIVRGLAEVTEDDCSLAMSITTSDCLKSEYESFDHKFTITFNNCFSSNRTNKNSDTAVIGHTLEYNLTNEGTYIFFLKKNVDSRINLSKVFINDNCITKRLAKIGAICKHLIGK